MVADVIDGVCDNAIQQTKNFLELRGLRLVVCKAERSLGVRPFIQQQRGFTDG
jgi:hypothetical protein